MNVRFDRPDLIDDARHPNLVDVSKLTLAAALEYEADDQAELGKSLPLAVARILRAAAADVRARGILTAEDFLTS